MNVFRDSFYNLITQIALAALTLWALPNLVSGLQPEVFGVLTILWTVLGYFSFLDLGISRAVVKYLSTAVESGTLYERQQLVWTSLVIVSGAGIMAGTLLAMMAPLIVHVFIGSSGGNYQDSVYTSVYHIAAGVPLLLLFSMIKGFFLAYKRFDIFNILTGLSGIVQNIGSVVLVWMGEGITSIIFLSVYSKAILIILAALALERVDKNIILRVPALNKRVFATLMSFGGWVSISQVISPLFNYIDRLMIGAILPLSFVAYYVVPQEAISRLLIIPMSLSTTLFPILSARSTRERLSEDLLPKYQQAVRFMTAVLVPISVLLALFSMDILSHWMGHPFAVESASVFSIVAAGFFFNGLAQIPSTLLQATGHPDIPAKFHLIELPLMVSMNAVLIPLYGIIGAAITWLFRVTLDFTLLFMASKRMIGIEYQKKHPEHASLRRMVPYIILAVIVPAGFIIEGVRLYFAVGIILSLYAATLWQFYLNDGEKNLIKDLVLHRRSV